MSQKYLLPMARNTITGVTVKNQDLNGVHYSESQRVLAEGLANQLAEKMTARTKEPWVGFVKLYTPTTRS